MLTIKKNCCTLSEKKPIYEHNNNNSIYNLFHIAGLLY